MMKVCVSYSESHSEFFKEFFIKSFIPEENVTLVVELLPQKCNSGELFSKGWRDQMIEKQIFINNCLKTSKAGEILLFCDVDIKFYGKICGDLTETMSYGDKDIYFMKDHNSDDTGKCGGFFVLRSCKKIKDFFKKTLSTLESFDSSSSVEWASSEQSTINNLLGERKDISWGFLSTEKYYTHGLYTKGIQNFSEKDQSGLWWDNKNDQEKRDIYVPSDILVHHANWCRGLNNKAELLSWVHGKLEWRANQAEFYKSKETGGL